MNYEVVLLNAVIDHNDYIFCLENNIGHFLDDHLEVWKYISDYHSKYLVLPTKTILKEHFSDFEMLNTKDAPLQYYFDEAKRETLARDVRENIMKSIDLLKKSGPNSAMNFMASSSHKLMREGGALKDINLSSDYKDRVADYKERFLSDKHILGIPSGITPIDEIFGGWQGGDLIILMGWTGSTKSWLALLFACNAWRAGYTPLFISLEMNKYQVAYRIDTILGGGERFTNDDLTHARGLDPDDYEEWLQKTFEGTPPFYLVTSEGIGSATQNTIRAKVEHYQPDLLFIDYHGLCEDADGGGTETDRVKNLSKAFKRIAVQYNIPVVDVAAVTMKDGHNDRPPTLSEVAWSKQLAYDADLVLSLHRPKDSDISQVVAEKVRRCQEFAFYLNWQLNSGIWSEMYESPGGNSF